jgi:hypothetical protein
MSYVDVVLCMFAGNVIVIVTTAIAVCRHGIQTLMANCIRRPSTLMLAR